MPFVLLGSTLLYAAFSQASEASPAQMHAFFLAVTMLTALTGWLSKRWEAVTSPSTFPTLLGWSVLAGSILVLAISQPLFENDHYRYFFEGKLLLEGVDVYENPPRDFFLGARQIYQDHLGFAHIPSIYGPLSHLLHGMAEKFLDFEGGSIFLKLLYLAVFLWIWMKAKRKEILLLSVPFLTKEFFNSIHLDFFAVLAFAGAYLYLVRGRYEWGWILVIVSVLFKPTGFVAVPILFAYSYNKMNRPFLAVAIFALAGYAYFVGSWEAVSIFAREWQWNGGVNYLAKRASFPLTPWLGLLVPLGMSVLFFGAQLRKGIWTPRQLAYQLMLIFLVQILYSGAVNSWYLAWPLAFAILSGERVIPWWIIAAWPLCYGPWRKSDLYALYTVVFHVSGHAAILLSLWRRAGEPSQSSRESPRSAYAI